MPSVYRTLWCSPESEVERHPNVNIPACGISARADFTLRLGCHRHGHAQERYSHES